MHANRSVAFATILIVAGVAAGLEMINAEDSALRLYYDGHFGETIQVQSVGLKGSAEF